ncbi:unnamed protein product [Medioppia subpectinata]|uniref:Gamma-interferon-inducible lysosomal thiol reductase n=1 Tax=Medioppia subpectinata TaxID=1979941 RepID=A0A7R9PX70_9ACAR|nr:unnamed protein product [Medioppia subpectinata]CAG2103650.1 unnamed protein product [Medioppia subpectinata]
MTLFLDLFQYLVSPIPEHLCVRSEPQTSQPLSAVFEETIECEETLVTNNRISVYYESICPDSRRFILNQLIPTYDKLSPYVDVDLIPFGNANVSYPNHDFKPYFQCQHGPDECYGNKAQACVIDLTKSTRPSLSYIKCMFSADNWRQTAITAQKFIAFSYD